MGAGDNLKKYMASVFNRDGAIFSALVADGNGKGAIANELDDLTGFIDYYILNTKMAEESGGTGQRFAGEVLDTAGKFFTGFVRNDGETDSSYLKRITTLLARNNDPVFGTKWNIKHIYESFLTSAAVYVVENTGSYEQENLLDNYDFESGLSWDFAECAPSTGEKFSRTSSLALDGAGTCSQTVKNLQGHFYLHFFLKGAVRVGILNAAHEYWNSSTNCWQSGAVYAEFEQKDWDDCAVRFYTETETDITVVFDGAAGTGNVDFTGLFKKELHGSFSVILSFSGEAGKNLLIAAPGTADSRDTMIDGYPYSYWNRNALQGIPSELTSSFYTELLEMVKPFGVKAYIEFVGITEE